MFPCPRCGQMLPPTAVACQFCHADVRHVPRPMTQAQKERIAGSPVTVLRVIALILGAIWILRGGLELLTGILMSQTADTAGNSILSAAFAGAGFFVGIFGCIHILLGTGILFRWSWIPTAVYIFCGFGIIGDLISLLGGNGYALIDLALQTTLIIVIAYSADTY